MSKRFFNANGVDSNRIAGRNPTGFVDFNDTTLKWANNSYDLMTSLMWFPSEVDCSNEAKSFQTLTENEQMIYKLVFANLSFLDSSQEQNIIDFREVITHKVLQSTLTLQAFTESNHSKSYATVLAEIGNASEVFNMFRTEDILRDRNERVAELFSRYNQYSTDENILCQAMSSILLEGLLFMTSFSYVFFLGDKMQGSSSIVSFIAKDEYAHQAVFSNIFKNLLKQNKYSEQVINNALSMLDDAVQIELDFAKHICTNYPVMGISYRDLEQTVWNYGNERLRALGMRERYQKGNETQMEKVVKKFSKVNDTRANLFEAGNKQYAKDTISFDDF